MNAVPRQDGTAFLFLISCVQHPMCTYTFPHITRSILCSQRLRSPKENENVACLPSFNAPMHLSRTVDPSKVNSSRKASQQRTPSTPPATWPHCPNMTRPRISVDKPGAQSSRIRARRLLALVTSLTQHFAVLLLAHPLAALLDDRTHLKPPFLRCKIATCPIVHCFGDFIHHMFISTGGVLRPQCIAIPIDSGELRFESITWGIFRRNATPIL